VVVRLEERAHEERHRVIAKVRGDVADAEPAVLVAGIGVRLDRSRQGLGVAAAPADVLVPDGSRRLVRVEDQGIEIEADFEWPAGGRSIYFRDPAGNCLEFAEPRIWGFEE
jgi:catechol 2,3-dioxygenase-like lactoylglutathione lyase family enzyme